MNKLYTFFCFIALYSNLAQGQTSTQSLSFAGNNRQYILHVPSIYSQTNASVPLVLVLHGLGDNMQNMSNVGFHQIADTANFIVATPQALPDPNPLIATLGPAWSSGASMFGITPNATLDDVGFLSALIDSVSAHYNIDRKRIYFTGFSMGGYMSNRMACERSDKIAAIASVAGTIGNSITCNPQEAVATAHFHGTADAVVAYSNNSSGMDAEELVEFWQQHNNCSETPIYTAFPNTNANDGYTVEKYLYPNGNRNTEVQFVKTIGADHTWLGPNNDIYYTAEIWKFLRKQEKTLVSSTAPTHTALLQWEAYPNPAQDQLHVKYPPNSPSAHLSLSDMLGNVWQKTEHKATDSETVLDISQLPAGIYLLSLETEQGRQMKKINKN